MNSTKHEVILLHTTEDFLPTLALKEILELSGVRVLLIPTDETGPKAAHIVDQLRTDGLMAIAMVSPPHEDKVKHSQAFQSMEERSKRDWKPFAHLLVMADDNKESRRSPKAHLHSLKWNWSFKTIAEAILLRLAELGWKRPQQTQSPTTEKHPGSQSIKGSRNTTIQGDLHAGGDINLHPKN